MTDRNGTFATPGWPDDYPQLNFRCTWTIEDMPAGHPIAFIFNRTAYGIYGNRPCTSDYIEFFDTADLSGASVEKYCGLSAPSQPVVIDGVSARVVFQGRTNQNRDIRHVGASVTYTILGEIVCCLAFVTHQFYSPI